MEFCPSSLKEERKQKGKMTETLVRKVLRDVCLGLAYLHRHSIAHLDIKPGKTYSLSFKNSHHNSRKHLDLEINEI